jgi:hypothetical protein
VPTTWVNTRVRCAWSGADADVVGEQPLQRAQAHAGVRGQQLRPGDLDSALRLGHQLGGLAAGRVGLGADLQEVVLQGRDHAGAVPGAEDPPGHRPVGEAELAIAGHSDDGYELVLSYDLG